MIKDILKYSASNIWKRKLRSSLTILSILIGITAIFALISFGQGLEKYIDDFAQEQGTDKILIQPKGLPAPGTSNIELNDEDVNFIRKIKGVDEATGWMVSYGKVEFKDFKDKYMLVLGFSSKSEERRLVEEIATIDIEQGRNLKKGDTLKALLGYNYLIPDKIFKRPITLGDKIEINDVQVEVIGFYEKVGNPQDDSQVYLSHEGFEKIFEENTFEYIAIRSSQGVDPSFLSEKIQTEFREYRGQEEGEEDFFVQTFEQAIETFTSVILIMNAVLVLIALISIIIAGVNIMNTMYTSILERTREIGIMKSIGAKNKTIQRIFMIESGILGLIGGILGVIFGFIIAKLGEFTAESYGLSFLKPVFSPWLILGCLLFALLIGIGSGFLPSLRASKLNPVEALRYE
tara:strand:- start:3333 stop:4544 length:1212 start_codon:yes stop_codon:yes gene_type:complete